MGLNDYCYGKKVDCTLPEPQIKGRASAPPMDIRPTLPNLFDKKDSEPACESNTEFEFSTPNGDKEFKIFHGLDCKF